MSGLDSELEGLLSIMSAIQADAFLAVCLGGNHSRTDAVPARQARRVRVIAAEVAERRAKAKLRRGGWHYPKCPETSGRAYYRVYEEVLAKQVAMAKAILSAPDER